MATSGGVRTNVTNCLQLVDAVSPKADEDLLELMVRIAENPSEWQQVHHVLREYRISIPWQVQSLTVTAAHVLMCVCSLRLSNIFHASFELGLSRAGWMLVYT